MKRFYKIIGIITMVALFFTTTGLNAGASVDADDEYPITYTVIASALNVRVGRGTQYKSFYLLKNGEKIQGKESIGGWSEVDCYGNKGFVCAKYLQKGQTETVMTDEKLKFLGMKHITGYSPFCQHCCGKSPSHPGFGITASGIKAVVRESVAMAGVPFGTRIYIKGLGYYTVHDRGVGYGVIDVACWNHNDCYAITGNYEVYIVE